MFDRKSFEIDKKSNVASMGASECLREQAEQLIINSDRFGYAYHRTWLGVPVIQLPEDVLLNQELFWKTKPNLVIETGVAWGGSIVLHASLMELNGTGRVIGIDRFIPDHIRDEIMKFGFSNRITLLECDSISRETFEKVAKLISVDDKVSVFLDSNHTHDHVLAELLGYSRFVSKDQYMSVYATAIEWMPKSEHRPRPWGPGNSPMTAIREFLKMSDRFVIDAEEKDKSLVSFSAGGRLRCVA